MGGRFGKYGDAKRKARLRRTRPGRKNRFQQEKFGKKDPVRLMNGRFKNVVVTVTKEKKEKLPGRAPDAAESTENEGGG